MVSTAGARPRRHRRGGGDVRSLDPEKVFAGALSAALIAGVLWPLRQNWCGTPRDSYPFSYFPMFSAKRKKRVRVRYLVGLDADGRRRLIPYTFFASGGLNMVRRQLRRLVIAGRADEVGRIVAKRLATCKDEDLAGIVTVSVVTGEYRLSDYFTGVKEPLSEWVHASCEVKR
jgi:hypothetical protein